MKAYKNPKKKLDEVFSKWIRLSNADENGYCTCITCGKVRQWNELMQAGHYISRKYLSTRFDERNVHPQCSGCNGFGNGRLDDYAVFLVGKYGINILTDLHEKKQKITKYSKADYHELIDMYKGKIENLNL